MTSEASHPELDSGSIQIIIDIDSGLSTTE